MSSYRDRRGRSIGQVCPTGATTTCRTHSRKGVSGRQVVVMGAIGQETKSSEWFTKTLWARLATFMAEG